MAVYEFLGDIPVGEKASEWLRERLERERASEGFNRVSTSITRRGMAAPSGKDPDERVIRVGVVSWEGRVLATREENGYHDSDFYAVVWNGEKVERVLYATTRGWTYLNSASTDASEEVIEAAREALAKAAFSVARSGARRRVEEPGPGEVRKGTELALTEAVTFTDKKRGGEPVEAEAGEIGRVIWIGSFGRFYRNGYNRPNRSNTRVGVRFEDGRVIFAALSKFSLAEDAESDEEIRERTAAWAARSDPGYAFASLTYPGVVL